MELVPIAVGIVLFLVGAVAALVTFCDSGGKQRRWVGYLGLTAAGIGLIPLILIMPPLHPTIESVSGHYVGSYAGGTETFDLFMDGTFQQTFVRDGYTVYSSRGTWTIEEKRVFADVSFYDIMVVVNGFGKPQVPERVDVYSGATLRLVSPVICFNEDTGQCIRRAPKRS